MKKILLFLLTFLACTYSAQAVEYHDLYLLGEWEWNHSDTYKFKNIGNGVYTLLVEDASKISGKQFKIANRDKNYWCGCSSLTVNLESNYNKLYSKDGNSATFGSFSSKSVLITITGKYDNGDGGERVEIAISDADKLWLRGYSTWDANEGAVNQFSRDGYKYTMAVTLNGATKWKIASNDYKTQFGLSTAITSERTYDLTYNGGEAGFNLPDGTYDLTFDFSTLKLTVAAHSETPTYQTLYLRGFNSWDVDKCLKFDNAEGTSEIYTLTIDYTTGSNIEWKIANSDYSYQYGASKAIAAAGEYTLTEGPQKGFSSSLASGTYDLEYNYNTHVLKVTKQGTTPDPDPEYPENIYYYYSSSSEMLKIAAKDQANGVYEATLTIAENASFRFYSNSNKADAYSYGPNTPVDGSGNNYEAYTLGETRGMTLTSTNRWQLTNTAGEYTFTVNLKNKTFTVVAKSVEYTKYYLRGDMNGWASPEVGDDTWELKTTDGLTYTLNNVTLVSGQQFKIGQAGESGWVGYCYGDTNGQKAIYPDGSEYKIYKDNSGNLKFDYVYDRPVNITFTLASIDSNEATLKVVYVDGAEITYPTLYLRGNFSGADWATNDDYIFTRSGDIYTLTDVDGATVKGNQWQIADGAWTYKFGSSSKISAEGTYTLAWDNNQGFDSSFPDGTYDLEYTYSTQTLKVTKQGAVVTYPDLWLRGGFNNWGNDGPEKNTAYKFTCIDGVYTLTVEAGKLSNCEFKIGSSETGVGVDWAYGFGGTATDGVTAKIGEAFTVYDKKGGKNIYIAENSYKFDIKFEPDFVNNTGELTISINNPSGIEDVEISNEAPVEFYNLQGVRVDGELTPGLYIRRQGNNASKVLIR